MDDPKEARTRAEHRQREQERAEREARARRIEKGMAAAKRIKARRKGERPLPANVHRMEVQCHDFGALPERTRAAIVRMAEAVRDGATIADEALGS